jgi:hypothetical protein
MKRMRVRTKSGRPTVARRWQRTAVVSAAAAALLLAAALYVRRPAPLVDLDSVLLSQGFVPNPGFAATFRPGDVIQITETDGTGGARKLARPVLFLRREICFPGRSPGEVPFGLSTASGKRALTLDAGRLGRLLPELQLRGGGTRSYSLAVDNLRVATFSRGELSERFAAPCVEAFGAALESGDRQAWFGTVTEAVVADALTLTIEWRAGTSGEARAALRQQVDGAWRGRGAVTAALDSTEKTVLRMTGPLVLGYRLRPMEAVR